MGMVLHLLNNTVVNKRKKVSLILLWDIMRRKDCWADQESDASTPWAPLCSCELSLHKCLLCFQFSRCTVAYAPQDGAFKAAYFPVLPSHFPFWTVKIWVCECLGKQNQYSNGGAHRLGGGLEDCWVIVIMKTDWSLALSWWTLLSASSKKTQETCLASVWWHKAREGNWCIWMILQNSESFQWAEI